MTWLRTMQWAFGILFVGMFCAVMAALVWQVLNPGLVHP